ncbi:MAG: hypothetical protein GQ531_07200 [Sulfurovum sp.]|nr:hypothetical protein [Sulfurovum sp.]
MTIEIMTEFLGWCSVINIGMLTLSSMFVILFKDTAVKIHTTMFKVDKTFLDQEYFKYLGHYKVITIIFNIVPYFALKIMT